MPNVLSHWANTLMFLIAQSILKNARLIKTKIYMFFVNHSIINNFKQNEAQC